MRITQNLREIKSNQAVDVSVDVYKDTLNFFFCVGGKEYCDECPNRTKSIEKRIRAHPCKSVVKK